MSVREFGKIPVFPCLVDVDGCEAREASTTGEQYPNHHHSGLSAREHYAAMAMQGILADGHDASDKTPRVVAAKAVAHADALLAELHDCVDTGGDQ